MNRSSTLSVCRNISLEIQALDRDGVLKTNWDRETGETPVMATPVPVPEATVNPAIFLKACLPDHPVEFIGKATIEFPFHWKYGAAPSSLFFQTLNRCFSQHHPFGIRPEVLMQIIVHEVATTVKMNPEHYRSLFTSKEKEEEGTIFIQSPNLALGNAGSPWLETLPRFEAGLRSLTPPGIMEHLLPDLSTHTPESRAASIVSFMDAASPFYSYSNGLLCGLPEIRLFGTPEDYKLLLTSAAQLSERFSDHLEQYFSHLLPVLETLADQAAGADVDEDFWTSIYSYKSISGNDHFAGWITDFVNYVTKAPSNYHKTPGALLQKPDDCYGLWKVNSRKGLKIGSVPSHLSAVPFTFLDLGTPHPMKYVGGPLGVEIIDGYATPCLSYAIVHAPAEETAEQPSE